MPRSHFYAAGVVAFGALFPLAAQAVTFTTLYTFANYTDGVFPQNLTYQGGKLYGDTVYGGYENCDTNYIGCGLVFQLDLASGVESTVYTFESTDNGRKFPHGGYPYGNIVDLHGKLYGTAGRGPHNEGVTFQVNIAKQTQKVLKTSTGSAVEGPDYLVEASGALFGTGNGGTNGNGLLFTVDPATGIESTVYQFTGGADGSHPAALTTQSGILYGAASGSVGTNCPGGGCSSIFSFNPSGGAFTVISTFPSGVPTPIRLVTAGTTLFGITPSGSAPCSLFAINLSNGAESVLYSFKPNADPNSLVFHNNSLYGTEYGNGRSEHGYVFKFDLAASHLTTLYNFTGGADGAAPVSLIFQNGAYYGTTYLGGQGTVFKLTTGN